MFEEGDTYTTTSVVNQWSDRYGFLASGMGDFTPVHRMRIGWSFFHNPIDFSPIYFQSLPTCLMFLETQAEIDEMLSS